MQLCTFFVNPSDGLAGLQFSDLGCTVHLAQDIVGHKVRHIGLVNVKQAVVNHDAFACVEHQQLAGVLDGLQTVLNLDSAFNLDGLDFLKVGKGVDGAVVVLCGSEVVLCHGEHVELVLATLVRCVLGDPGHVHLVALNLDLPVQMTDLKVLLVILSRVDPDQLVVDFLVLDDTVLGDHLDLVGVHLEAHHVLAFELLALQFLERLKFEICFTVSRENLNVIFGRVTNKFV